MTDIESIWITVVKAVVKNRINRIIMVYRAYRKTKQIAPADDIQGIIDSSILESDTTHKSCKSDKKKTVEPR